MSTSPRPDPAGSTRYWLTGPGWERLRERPEGPTSSGSGEQDSDPEGVAMMLVARGDGVGWRLEGTWSDAVVANRFLAHLATRGFSSATIRAYAYDLVNFGRFALERRVSVADAVPTDFFDYLDWQARAKSTAGAKVVRLADRRGPAPATMNRRIAAVRGLFEFAVTAGLGAEHPVPTARRSSGLRPKQRGLLGHLGPGRARAGGRLVRQPRRLPESLEPEEVAAFVADLGTHRDRSTGCSSPSLRATCIASGRRGVPPPSALWCCAARRRAGRSPRPGCARSSAPTGPARAPPGCGPTGCAAAARGRL